MSFDFSTLVTDRSQTDLDTLRALLATPMADWTAEQLAEFNQAISKGSYNYTDLNRVTACMDYLNEVLTGLGYETGYQRIVVPHQEEPSPVGPLPDGYTELEYIQSAGTQYINTGVQPNQNTRVTATAYLTPSDAGTWLFGARNANSDSTFGFLSYENAYRSDYNTDQNKTIPAAYSDPFEIDKNKNQTQINGEKEATSSAGTFQCNYPLILFANNSGGNISGFGSGKIYQLSVYDNGILVRNFIPCQNPSGEIGLYDTENSQFYGNAGTGVFIAGPEVPRPEPEPTLDPYTWYESDTPTASLMDAYLANVAALRAVLDLPETTPEVPADMDRLTQAEANDIERIMEIVDIYIVTLQKSFLRSGMSWAVSGGPGFYFSN